MQPDFCFLPSQQPQKVSSITTLQPEMVGKPWLACIRIDSWRIIPEWLILCHQHAQTSQGYALPNESDLIHVPNEALVEDRAIFLCREMASAKY